MILVTLGTQDKPFPRLLKEVEKQIKKGNITDEVIVQAGCTKYKSKYMKIFDLIELDEFDDLVKKCDLLITHGGVGTIVGALKQKKKIIAVARLKKYGEHTNDHQIQLVTNFAKEKYILGLVDFDSLDETLKQVKTFKPKKCPPKSNNMIKIIESFIDQI